MGRLVLALRLCRQREHGAVPRCIRQDRPFLVDKADVSVGPDDFIQRLAGTPAEGAVVVEEGDNVQRALRVAAHRRSRIVQDHLRIEILREGSVAKAAETQEKSCGTHAEKELTAGCRPAEKWRRPCMFVSLVHDRPALLSMRRSLTTALKAGLS